MATRPARSEPGAAEATPPPAFLGAGGGGGGGLHGGGGGGANNASASADQNDGNGGGGAGSSFVATSVASPTLTAGTNPSSGGDGSVTFDYTARNEPCTSPSVPPAAAAAPAAIATPTFTG
jgi:hypothetical protein